MKSVITQINQSVLLNSPKSEWARLLDQKVDDPCLTIEVEEENQQLHGLPDKMYFRPRDVFRNSRMTIRELTYITLRDIIRSKLPYPNRWGV